AERRFQRIAMSLGDGLVCVDHRERITLWNSAAETIFGYRSGDIVGRSFQTLLEQPARLELIDFQEHHGAPHGSRIVETEGRRQNGEAFPLELSLAAWQ